MSMYHVSIYAPMLEKMADSSVKAKKRKWYSLEFKIKCVKEARLTSGEATAKKYGFHPRRLREWKKQMPKLQEAVEQNQNENSSRNDDGAQQNGTQQTTPETQSQETVSDMEDFDADTEVDEPTAPEGGDMEVSQPPASTPTTSAVTVSRKEKQQQQSRKKTIKKKTRKRLPCSTPHKVRERVDCCLQGVIECK